ncbi:MAG: AraC family transcriptional regulator [Tepidisphaeraceae bacterium]
MRVFPIDLREMHIVGSHTLEQIIGQKISPLMKTLNIGLTGVSDAGRGFSMVRHKPPYGHVVACFAGRGDVLVDGKWESCGPGMAYLTPPDVLHAYRTVEGTRWNFAWLWWHPSPTGEPPLIDCPRPSLVRADPEYLRSAILGLYRESMGPAQATVIDHWIELLHAYAVRLGRAAKHSRRRSLLPLWERVDAKPAHPWTLAELAEMSALSTEHLRRLCQQQTGRGPMHHVTFLRMRRAATLLESTQQKIRSIARSVGYQNAFAFSTAFKRVLKISPDAYRKRRSRERRPVRDAVRERVNNPGKLWD